MLKNTIKLTKWRNFLQNSLYFDFLLKIILKKTIFIVQKITVFFLEKFLVDFIPKKLYTITNFNKTILNKINYNFFNNIIIFLNIILLIFIL